MDQKKSMWVKKNHINNYFFGGFVGKISNFAPHEILLHPMNELHLVIGLNSGGFRGIEPCLHFDLKKVLLRIFREGVLLYE